jgi:hypothetical protein
MTSAAPIYDSTTTLAKRAGVHRTVVVRLVVAGHLEPAAWVIEGQEKAALFRPECAVTVLQLQKAHRGNRWPSPSPKVSK